MALNDKYEKQKETLLGIQSQLMSIGNPFSLTNEEIIELRIVIAGLIEIANDIVNLKKNRDGHIDLSANNATLRGLLGDKKQLAYHVENYSDNQCVRNYIEKPSLEKRLEMKRKITACQNKVTKESKDDNEVIYNKIDTLFALAQQIYDKELGYAAARVEQKAEELVNVKEAIGVLKKERDTLIRELLQNQNYRTAFIDDLNDDKRETEMIKNTVTQFIEQYEKVAIQGKEHVKKFISLLGGICIDARMRAAFDYSYRLRELRFSDVLKQSIDSVAKPEDEKTYFQIAAQFFSHTAFGKRYCSEGVYSKAGMFDAACFPQLITMLDSFALEPGSDFINELILADSRVLLPADPLEAAVALPSVVANKPNEEKLKPNEKKEKPKEAAIESNKIIFLWKPENIKCYLAFIAETATVHLRQLAKKNPKDYAFFISLAIKYQAFDPKQMRALLRGLHNDNDFFALFLEYFTTVEYDDFNYFKDFIHDIWGMVEVGQFSELQNAFAQNKKNFLLIAASNSANCKLLTYATEQLIDNAKIFQGISQSLDNKVHIANGTDKPPVDKMQQVIDTCKAMHFKIQDRLKLSRFHDFVAKTATVKQLQALFNTAEEKNDSVSRELLPETIIRAVKFRNFGLCELLVTYPLYQGDTDYPIKEWEYDVLVNLVNASQWELASQFIDRIVEKDKKLFNLENVSVFQLSQQAEVSHKQKVFYFFLNKLLEIETKSPHYKVPQDEVIYNHNERGFVPVTLPSNTEISKTITLLFFAFSHDEIQAMMDTNAEDRLRASMAQALIEHFEKMNFTKFMTAAASEPWLKHIIEYFIRPTKKVNRLEPLFESYAINVTHFVPHFKQLLSDRERLYTLLKMKCNTTCHCEKEHGFIIPHGTTMLHQLTMDDSVDIQTTMEFFTEFLLDGSNNKYFLMQPNGPKGVTPLSYSIYRDLSLFELLIKSLIELADGDEQSIRSVLREFEFDINVSSQSTLARVLTHNSKKPLQILLKYISQDCLVNILMKRNLISPLFGQANLLSELRSRIPAENYEVLLNFLQERIFEVIDDGFAALPVRAVKENPKIMEKLVLLAERANYAEVSSLSVAIDDSVDKVNYSEQFDSMMEHLTHLMNSDQDAIASLLNAWPVRSFNSVVNDPSNFFNFAWRLKEGTNVKVFSAFFTRLTSRNLKKLLHSMFDKALSSKNMILAAGIFVPRNVNDDLSLDEIRKQHVRKMVRQWYHTALSLANFKLASFFREALLQQLPEQTILPKPHLYRDIACCFIDQEPNEDELLPLLKMTLPSQLLEVIKMPFLKGAKLESFVGSKEISCILDIVMRRSHLLKLFLPRLDEVNRPLLLEKAFECLMQELDQFLKHKNKDFVNDPRPLFIDGFCSQYEKIILASSEAKMGLHILVELLNLGLDPISIAAGFEKQDRQMQTYIKEMLFSRLETLPGILQSWVLIKYDDTNRALEKIRHLKKIKKISDYTLHCITENNVAILDAFELKNLSVQGISTQADLNNAIECIKNKEKTDVLWIIPLYKSLIAKHKTVASYWWDAHLKYLMDGLYSLYVNERKTFTNFHAKIFYELALLRFYVDNNKPSAHISGNLAVDFERQYETIHGWYGKFKVERIGEIVSRTTLSKHDIETDVEPYLESYMGECKDEYIALQMKRYQLLDYSERLLQTFYTEIISLPKKELIKMAYESENARDNTADEGEDMGAFYSDIFTNMSSDQAELYGMLIRDSKVEDLIERAEKETKASSTPKKVLLHFSALPHLAKKFDKPALLQMHHIYLLMNTLDDPLCSSVELLQDALQQFENTLRSPAFVKLIAQHHDLFSFFKDAPPGKLFIEKCFRVLHLTTPKPAASPPPL